MKTRLVLFATLALVVATGCATIPWDTQLLSDVKIVPPDPSVPRNLAAFSGKWGGPWLGRITSTFITDHILVVEKITPPSATVIYATESNPQWGIPRRATRLQAEFVNGELSFFFPPRAATVTYRMNPNGTLSGTFTVGAAQNVATLYRIQ